MGEVAVIGLDIAKSVFQVHGVDSAGVVVIQRKLTRARLLPFFEALPRCLLGIEACATAHHWARQLREMGFAVRLMPPGYVKPYVKRQKNDMADAEAICEAVTRPTMSFVEIKSPEQQSVMVLHRTRQTLMRQRVQLSNTIRAHIAEFGLVAPTGREGLQRLIDSLPTIDQAPPIARTCLMMLASQLKLVNEQILQTDRAILASVRGNEVARRLMTIPGVGPLVASAIVASVPDPKAFRSGRNLAAWIGLVPKQNSSGGKERLGSITKAGNRYLRQMLVVGALAVIRRAKQCGSHRTWLTQLMSRRNTKQVAVALANKTARTIWALMTSGQAYREPAALAE